MSVFYKLFFYILLFSVIASCKEKEPTPEKPPVPSFIYTPSVDNPNSIFFKSTSSNATSVAWDFGNQRTSLKEEETVVYSSRGTYKVTLTATGKGGRQSASQTIVINTDDLCEDINRKRLSGGCELPSGKTWVWHPLDEMDFRGPIGGDIKGWWHKTLSEQPDCLKDDEYTFRANTTFIANTGGEQWGVLNGEEYKCVPQPNKTDSSTWDIQPVEGKLMLKITKQLTIGWDDNIGEYEILEISQSRLIIRKICCNNTGYRNYILVPKQ